MERKGGKVRDQLNVEQRFKSAQAKPVSSCNAEGKPVGGKVARENHENKTQRRVDHSLPIASVFVGRRLAMALLPPA